MVHDKNLRSSADQNISSAAHVHRRGLFGLAAGGLCACCLGAGMTASSPALAAKGGTDLSPDQALELLRKGNREFVTDSPIRAVPGRQRRLELARSQTPFAVMVACSDSRVPPELLFGRGLGELFIVRNAGNTVDSTAQGSIEYAVLKLGVPLVVVMGHERCGAVEAAVSLVKDNVRFPGSMREMLVPILPAVLEAQRLPGDLVDNAVRLNVSHVAERLRQSEAVLLEPLRTGKLKIVGARYDLDDGAVDFFDGV